jgi:LysR family transcriptional regulator, low CO2-responsive transcriptional regulator
LNLEQLRAFVAVVKLGTLTRAAEELHLSQSTLSFRIKGLEESVESKLLDRGGAGARPTSAGRVLLPYAERLLELAEEGMMRLKGAVDEPAGEVVFATSTVPVEYLLPALLATFREDHAQVSLIARVMDSRAATRALLDDECELAFVGSEVSDKRRLICEPFAVDEIVLVVRAGESPVPVRVDPEQLDELPWVRRAVGSGTRRAVDQLLGELGVARRGQVEVSSTEAVRRCVLAGLGVAFVSRAAVQEDLSSGRLRLVDHPGTPLPRTFFALRPRARTLSPAAEAFWNHVRRDGA